MSHKSIYFSLKSESSAHALQWLLACRTWAALQYSFLSGWLSNGTFTRRDSILAETAFVNRATSDADPYDQYEFSILLSNIGTCIRKVTSSPRALVLRPNRCISLASS